MTGIFFNTKMTTRLNLQIEKNIYRKGYKLIAGIDEAGRGSWAGPIVAAAVILNKTKLMEYRQAGINDSKKLTPSKREKLFSFITENCVSWSVGIVSSKMIDKVGIGPANKLVMEKAWKSLLLEPDYLLIDAVKLKNIDVASESIIRGDAKSVSIAAASIVAKVWRDKILEEKDRKFPLYGFARHKGYGTAYHYRMLQKYGLCELHRLSFQPMRSMGA